VVLVVGVISSRMVVEVIRSIIDRTSNSNRSRRVTTIGVLRVMMEVREDSRGEEMSIRRGSSSQRR
jgi:hypothetical protein